MPRLPKDVPLSKPADDGFIYSSLVFACTICWESDAWGFVAYNHNGNIYQIRRCFGQYCFKPIRDGEEAKGKWITPEERAKKTEWQITGGLE